MTYEYVHGVETELQKLADFPAKVEANVARGAVRAAAQVERGAALPLVPVGVGKSGIHLQDTLRVSTSLRYGVARAVLKVGNPKKGVFYAGFVMGGTRAHLIKGHGEGSLSFGGLVRRSAHHPGARAQPFMAQADAQSRDAALKAAFDYADERLKSLIAEQDNAPS